MYNVSITSHRFLFFFKTLQTKRLKFLQVDTKTTTTKNTQEGLGGLSVVVLVYSGMLSCAK